jgi:competence protein ComEC
VAGLLMLAGSKAVGKRRAVPLALAGIVLYTLLVGADAAVVRAAIMGCLYMLALYFGRQTEVRTSLIFSVLLMTAINPHTLWDVGLQLSFAATAGLIWVTPPLERVAERWLTALVGAQHVRRVMGLLSEALLVTLAAQIATEPLIVYHFGRMSAVSLLTNLLILPVQPMVMLAGGLATMAGMIWLPLGQLLGWLAWLPLAWSERFNDHSVVLRVTLGEISFLLPGDVEAGVEQGLVAHSPSLAATVLKVPHHGGDTSSSQAFLEIRITYLPIHHFDGLSDAVSPA